MASISYIKLFTYLTKEEGLGPEEAIRSINRIRKLDNQLKRALIAWLNKESVNIVINGVSFDELVNDENFTPVRAFLMLDWIKREPKQALRYMAFERMSQSLPPAEEFQQRLREALNSEGKVAPDELSDIDKSDIATE